MDLNIGASSKDLDSSMSTASSPPILNATTTDTSNAQSGAPVSTGSSIGSASEHKSGSKDASKSVNINEAADNSGNRTVHGNTTNTTNTTISSGPNSMGTTQSTNVLASDIGDNIANRVSSDIGHPRGPPPHSSNSNGGVIIRDYSIDQDHPTAQSFISVKFTSLNDDIYNQVFYFFFGSEHHSEALSAPTPVVDQPFTYVIGARIPMDKLAGTKPPQSRFLASSRNPQKTSSFLQATSAAASDLKRNADITTTTAKIVTTRDIDGFRDSTKSTTATGTPPGIVGITAKNTSVDQSAFNLTLSSSGDADPAAESSSYSALTTEDYQVDTNHPNENDNVSIYLIFHDRSTPWKSQSIYVCDIFTASETSPALEILQKRSTETLAADGTVQSNSLSTQQQHGMAKATAALNHPTNYQATSAANFVSSQVVSSSSPAAESRVAEPGVLVTDYINNQGQKHSQQQVNALVAQQQHQQHQRHQPYQRQAGEYNQEKIASPLLAQRSYSSSKAQLAQGRSTTTSTIDDSREPANRANAASSAGPRHSQNVQPQPHLAAFNSVSSDGPSADNRYSSRQDHQQLPADLVTKANPTDPYQQQHQKQNRNQRQSPAIAFYPPPPPSPSSSHSSHSSQSVLGYPHSAISGSPRYNLARPLSSSSAHDTQSLQTGAMRYNQPGYFYPNLNDPNIDNSPVSSARRSSSELSSNNISAASASGPSLTNTPVQSDQDASSAYGNIGSSQQMLAQDYQQHPISQNMPSTEHIAASPVAGGSLYQYHYNKPGSPWPTRDSSQALPNTAPTFYDPSFDDVQQQQQQQQPSSGTMYYEWDSQGSLGMPATDTFQQPNKNSKQLPPGMRAESGAQALDPSGANRGSSSSGSWYNQNPNPNPNQNFGQGQNTEYPVSSMIANQSQQLAGGFQAPPYGVGAPVDNNPVRSSSLYGAPPVIRRSTSQNFEVGSSSTIGGISLPSLPRNMINAHMQPPPLVRTTSLNRPPAHGSGSQIQQPVTYIYDQRTSGYFDNAGSSRGPDNRMPSATPREGLLKASLEIIGNLSSMSLSWTLEEWEAKRRLVQFHRTQTGPVITVQFAPIELAKYTPDIACVSCIHWEQKNEFFVTSVDCIYLLEQLVNSKFSVEEKNRIRRNLERYHPLTISKGKPDCGDFFRLIMSFKNPRPRNIEKDVKVFPWRILGKALQKIISKYSADLP